MMNRVTTGALAILIGGLVVTSVGLPADRPVQARPVAIGSSLTGIPSVPFVPNAGQASPDVRFLAAGPAGTLAFGDDIVRLVLPPAHPNDGNTTVGIAFLDANASGPIAELPAGRANVLVGANEANWLTGLQAYGALRYRALYPGIDLRYELRGGLLKGDYLLDPGADPNVIRWRYDQPTELRDGAIAVGCDRDRCRLIERVPVAWQEIDGRRVAVPVSYRTNGDGSFGFTLGAYDRTRPLVVDPPIDFATHLGGSGSEIAISLAVDSAGNLYLAGATNSSNFPIAGSPVQSGYRGNGDVFVSKFNAAGSALLWSTYLGGAGSDFAYALEVDGAGYVYLGGSTQSDNFPVARPIQSFRRGASDGFVAKLNPSGSELLWSTLYGGDGDDVVQAIAVDGAGNAYAAGATRSTNLLLSGNPFDSSAAGGGDGFILKIRAPGDLLVYATYLGGRNFDSIDSIAVDGAGDLYLTGATFSDDFPIAGSPAERTYRGGSDAFVTKLNNAGSGILWSTFLGGSDNDYGHGLAIDSAGNSYLTGFTDSEDFPLAGSSFQGTPRGGVDAFVTKLNAAGSRFLYSTYLSGSGDDLGHGIAVDGSGSAVVTGWTRSLDFPVANAVQSGSRGGTDAFVTRLNVSGSALPFSTYLGGSDADFGYAIALDSGGAIVVAGTTYSGDFPAIHAFQGGSAGSNDAFIVRYQSEATPTPTASPTATATSTPTATPTVTPTPLRSVQTSNTLLRFPTPIR